jgi:proton-coupled amino acid transporter
VLAVVLGLTFALQMNPVWALIESALLRQGSCRVAWPLLRGGVVGLIALGCWLVPTVEGMVAISGSIGFSLIGFILPGLFYLRIFAPVQGIPTRSSAGGGCAEPHQRWWEHTKAAAWRIPRVLTRDRLLGRPASSGEACERVVALVLVGVGTTGSVLGVASIFQADVDSALPFPDC